MLRTVQATRYVLPLREGGSLPAIVEADDFGLYVVKFRGAGQGPLALVAELIAGEIARALGLNVPEIVFIQIDPALGRNEPDYEIRRLLTASPGLNLALDYLPGSTTFDPAARDTAAPAEASMTVWFDAFTQNVDRTARNANLLLWHRRLYLIDHGAALFFHHNWPAMREKVASPYPEVQHHVLLPWASHIAEASAAASRLLTRQRIEQIVALVPGSWLESIPPNPVQDQPASEKRAAYVDYLVTRLQNAQIFEQEAIRAHARLV
jgi:hypothetical protein